MATTFELTLYKGINPNTANNVYYYLASQSAYNTFIDNASYKVATIQIHDYRINTEVVKIAISETITEAVASMITYLRYNINGTYKYYNVNNYTIQSDYVIFYVSLDYWATYVYGATITLLNVTRCNRNIGVGIYDPIKAISTETKEFIGITGRTSNYTNLGINSIFDYSHLNLILAIKYNIYESSAGNVSTIKLVGINLKKYKDDLVTLLNSLGQTTEAQEAEAMNALLLVIYFMNGIYAVRKGTDLTAQVLGAWLVEDVCPITTSYDFEILSNNTPWFTTHGVKFASCNYTKKPTDYYRTIAITGLSPNYEYVVGTAHNGLKLMRTTQSTINVTVKYILETDKIRVIIAQGDNEADITDAFAFNVSNVDGDLRETARLIMAIKASMGFASSGINAIASASSGNYTGLANGIMGIGNSLASPQLLGYNAGRMSNIIKGGDALTTYYVSNIGSSTVNNVRNPYMITKYESLDNEVLHAKTNGAEFKVFNETINNIVTNCNLLSTGSVAPNDELIIQATARVTGIPTDAINAITNLLGGGIRILCNIAT